MNEHSQDFVHAKQFVGIVNGMSTVNDVCNKKKAILLAIFRPVMKGFLSIFNPSVPAIGAQYMMTTTPFALVLGYSTFFSLTFDFIDSVQVNNG